VHDIITILNRRFRNLHIEIVGGQSPRHGVENEIRDALALVNERADSDVIILARGGGSLEDLQAFNSETVATAIFQSKIPRHFRRRPRDRCDHRRFRRRPTGTTPSAAAELVVPEKKRAASAQSGASQSPICKFYGSSKRVKQKHRGFEAKTHRPAPQNTGTLAMGRRSNWPAGTFI